MDAGLSGFIEKLPLEKTAISGKQALTSGVYVLRFKRKHNFLAGQVVALTTDTTIPPRLYSICSGVSEEEISILFNVKEDGLLTPLLSKLQMGDSILVSAPFGAFLGDDKPSWWIAAGTGVAPFRSMLRSGMEKEKKLIHGGRTSDSFYFQQEMMPLLGNRYIRCCSQEKGEGLYEGRLTQWLREQYSLPEGIMYYLCGSSEMVVEVRDILIEKGVAIDKIMSEIYF